MTSTTGEHRRAVLFDLDGTLVDTAPDMVRVLWDMQDARDAPRLPYALVRSTVSNGSLGLVRLGFPQTADAELRSLQAEYLERYAAEVYRDSVLFPGLENLLRRLEIAERPWGIVTNKPERMTRALLEGMELHERAACVVSGDTLPQRKPDPAPLLLGCEQAGVDPAQTLYIGDALRDIAAGRAAGMLTIAAAYGYITADDSPDRWQADFIAADTGELATIVEKAVNLAA